MIKLDTDIQIKMNISKYIEVELEFLSFLK